MTPEQRLCTNVLKKQKLRKPAKNESIHQSVLDKDDDYYLSAKKVKDWIKSQKESNV